MWTCKGAERRAVCVCVSGMCPSALVNMRCVVQRARASTLACVHGQKVAEKTKVVKPKLGEQAVRDAWPDRLYQVIQSPGPTRWSNHLGQFADEPRVVGIGRLNQVLSGGLHHLPRKCPPQTSLENPNYSLLDLTIQPSLEARYSLARPEP